MGSSPCSHRQSSQAARASSQGWGREEQKHFRQDKHPHHLHCCGTQKSLVWVKARPWNKADPGSQSELLLNTARLSSVPDISPWGFQGISEPRQSCLGTKGLQGKAAAVPGMELGPGGALPPQGSSDSSWFVLWPLSCRKLPLEECGMLPNQPWSSHVTPGPAPEGNQPHTVYFGGLNSARQSVLCYSQSRPFLFKKFP